VSKPLTSGQWLQHERFGLGVTVSSDEQRTTIDFDEHGRKVFVTEMLEVQLAPAPDRPRARRARKPTPTS
jgi:hypothetical protein